MRQAVKDYLRLQIGVLEHEVFTVIFLDAQHRLIALKETLAFNAAAVILAHNHPRAQRSRVAPTSS